MPVPDQRDPEITLRSLADWLDGRLPGARIPALETPATSGFSNETLMFDADWTDPGDGRGHRGTYVARVAPVRYQIFPEPRFEEQYRLMRILDERTDIPVPPIHWYEPSPGPLGAPFFVMGRVEGRVPTDMPPYHMDGWVTEVPPEERAAMWWSALEILARVHKLDPVALDLRFLDQPEWGQFEDHTILCIVQEDEKGRRMLEEATRVWSDESREPEFLGRPEYHPIYVDDTREVSTATIVFSPPGGRPFAVRATPILPVHMMVGTGYGLEPGWKHGMYQGPGLKVEGVSLDLRKEEDAARMWGMVDAVGRYEYLDGAAPTSHDTGYGLYEYWALGPHPSFKS
jgi:hypothetical protein